MVFINQGINLKDLFLERSWDGIIWELPVFIERRRSPREGSVSPNHVKNNKSLRFSISSFKPSRFNGERIQLIAIYYPWIACFDQLFNSGNFGLDAGSGSRVAGMTI